MLSELDLLKALSENLDLKFELGGWLIKGLKVAVK